MKHRYTIMGKQYGSDREVELAQCDSNPKGLLEGLKGKSLRIESGTKKVSIPKYTWLRIVDNGPEDHVQP